MCEMLRQAQWMLSAPILNVSRLSGLLRGLRGGGGQPGGWCVSNCSTVGSVKRKVKSSLEVVGVLHVHWMVVYSWVKECCPQL